MVPSVCHIPKVGIKSQTDIIAHLDGAQCPQRINKLISSLTQTSKRTTMVPSVYNVTTSWYWVSHRHHCSVSATYQLVDIDYPIDIVANLEGVQCLQHTNKLSISYRHHGALRKCPMSATYQQVDIESHSDIIANLVGAQCLQHTNKLISRVTQTSSRT